MAQRLTVLLLLASILVIAHAAEGFSAEAASQKYDKKPHKYEKHDKHDAYMAEGHKAEGYKPEGYKPEGYTPEGSKPGYKPVYKPEGYKPDAYKTGYNYIEKRYEHHDDGMYGGKRYGQYNGDHSYGYLPEGYDMIESPYDGGYWGGPNGRQIIHLQTVFPESLLNTSLINTRGAAASRAAPVFPCLEGGASCFEDLGVLCGWRHHESESYGPGKDYASGTHSPIFQSTPVNPTAIGTQFFNFEPVFGEDLFGVNLVTFNGHQKGYRIGFINGFIDFVDGADACHPLLGDDTTITFNQHNVPVYLIIGKIRLPVDPAFLLPLGGLGLDASDLIINLPLRKAGSKAASASVMGQSDEYKTTPAGTKYKADKDYVYVLNEKDNTLCGLSLVARGQAEMSVPSDAPMTPPQLYSGFMEWPIFWTDVITTLPLLITDPSNDQFARQEQIIVSWFGKLLDRLAAVCKANDDIPWITPGGITFDLTPVPPTAR